MRSIAARMPDCPVVQYLSGPVVRLCGRLAAERLQMCCFEVPVRFLLGWLDGVTVTYG